MKELEDLLPENRKADKMLKVMLSGAYTKSLEIIYEDNKELFDRIKCYRCHARCCNDLMALPISLLDKNKKIEKEFGDTIKRAHFITLENTQQEFPAPKDYMFVQTPDHKCLFLDRKTNKCRVYEKRSILCKVAPFSTLYQDKCNAIKSTFEQKLKIDNKKIIEVTDKLVDKADKSGYYLGDVLIESEKVDK